MQHDFGYMWTVKMLNSGQLSEAVGRGGGGDGERLITGQISLKTQDALTVQQDDYCQQPCLCVSKQEQI